MSKQTYARLALVLGLMVAIAVLAKLAIDSAKPQPGCEARLTVPLSLEGDPVSLKVGNIISVMHVNEEGMYAFLKYNRAADESYWVWVPPSSVDMIEAYCTINRIE